MNFPQTITELIQQASALRLTTFDMRLTYEIFARRYGFTFKENLTSYSIWDKHLCLVRYDIETRTQVLENEQKQIAGKEINKN